MIFSSVKAVNQIYKLYTIFFQIYSCNVWKRMLGISNTGPRKKQCFLATPEINNIYQFHLRLGMYITLSNRSKQRASLRVHLFIMISKDSVSDWHDAIIDTLFLRYCNLQGRLCNHWSFKVREEIHSQAVIILISEGAHVNCLLICIYIV